MMSSICISVNNILSGNSTIYLFTLQNIYFRVYQQWVFFVGGVRDAQSLMFCVVVRTLLFVYFFLWPLYSLSFVWLFLITHLYLQAFPVYYSVFQLHLYISYSWENVFWWDLILLIILVYCDLIWVFLLFVC